MKFKCIIFDCDGVLVDSESISAGIFQNMLEELGCNLDFDTVLKQITGTSMKVNLEFFQECLGGNLPDDFESEFRKRSFEAFKTELKPVNGIHSLLNKITVPICTASSGPQNKIRLNLTTAGLIHKFGDNIYSSYDKGSWKPEPEIYLYTAKNMGFDPVDCAVIEDSEPGVIAAVKGGFNVFAFATKEHKSKFEKLGATVFHSMHELEELLDIN